MTDEDWNRFRQQFRLQCLRCGAYDDAITVDAEEGYMVSEVTGWSPGWINVGCNACKQNDFHGEN